LSKYEPLWQYIAQNAPEIVTFEQIQRISGFQIDHSFLSCKKELSEYGFEIGKISMKNGTVAVKKV